MLHNCYPYNFPIVGGWFFVQLSQEQTQRDTELEELSNKVGSNESKHLHSLGKSPFLMGKSQFLMGKSTISMCHFQ